MIMLEISIYIYILNNLYNNNNDLLQCSKWLKISERMPTFFTPHIL